MNLPGVYDIFLERWKDLQTCWIISDTHFGDEELRQGIRNRPSDEELVKIINSKVGKKDLLIHIGDVGNLEYMKQIRGYKILICGNHDMGHTLYKDVFQEVYSGPLMIGEKLILSHEPVDVPWAYNLHGHDHQGHKRKNHTNVCVDVTDYQPINMNQWMKSGAMAHIETIHRDTIDKATVRKRKRGSKKLGER